MNVWYSLLIALSMYSRIPVPTVEWKRERTRYVMAWFPAVGVFCFLAMGLWAFVSGAFAFSPLAAGLLGTAVPILVTGGIHMDGFLDTMDALGSYGDRERKLEILKDPHTGAFAVIGCAAYLLCYGGLMAELFSCDWGPEPWLLLGVSFVMERAFSGLSVACFPCAKGSGLAAAFADTDQKRAVRLALGLWIFACLAGLTATGGLLGAAVAAGQGLVFGWYYWLAKKRFGGITGDVAGYFLQVCEAVSLAVIVFGGKLGGF